MDGYRELVVRGGSQRIIDDITRRVYIVHMKHVTATEARKNWFKLLDEAARGEVIAIHRADKKLILRLERRKKAIPSYKGLISGDVENADKWGWDYTDKGLVPITKK